MRFAGTKKRSHDNKATESCTSTLVYFLNHNDYNLINNYSLKWRRLAVDVYRAAKRLGKYPTLATDTEVNSCFSIY